MKETPQSTPPSSPNPVTSPVVIFDGDCPFCHLWVRWLLRVDKNEYFLFATANSAFAAQLSSRFIQTGVDPEKEVVLYHDGQCYGGHKAVFQILKILGGGWRLFRVFRALPDSLLRKVYAFIAAKRFYWPSQNKDSCSVPYPGWSGRFLH